MFLRTYKYLILLYYMEGMNPMNPMNPMGGMVQPPMLQPPHRKTWVWIVVIVVVLVALFLAYAYYLGAPAGNGGVSLQESAAEDLSLERDLQATEVDNLDVELNDIDTTLSQ